MLEPITVTIIYTTTIADIPPIIIFLFIFEFLIIFPITSAKINDSNAIINPNKPTLVPINKHKNIPSIIISPIIIFL